MKIRRRFSKMGFDIAVIPLIDVVYLVLLVLFVSLSVNGANLPFAGSYAVDANGVANFDAENPLYNRRNLQENSLFEKAVKSSSKTAVEMSSTLENTEGAMLPVPDGLIANEPFDNAPVASTRFVIALASDGSLAVNGSAIKESALSDIVKSYPVPDEEKETFPITIVVARDAPAGAVLYLAKMVSNAGYKNIDIRTTE